MYSTKKIFWLSALYDLALVVLAFGTVFLEFSMAKVVDTEITFLFLLPWPTDTVEVNPLCYAAGILLAAAGSYFLWKWHASVLAKREGAFTKGWKAGYIILRILSVILCFFAEAVAYFLVLFDATVKNGAFLLPVSFLLIPVITVVLAIRTKRRG
jgi:hypothetical protein